MRDILEREGFFIVDNHERTLQYEMLIERFRELLKQHGTYKLLNLLNEIK